MRLRPGSALSASIFLLALTSLWVGCPSSTAIEDDDIGRLEAPPLTVDPGPEGTPPAAGRLPTDVRPMHYRLALHIDPSEDAGIVGEVSIRTQLDAPRRVIWMHGRRLEVLAATVTPVDGPPMEAAWTTQEDDDHFAKLTLPRALEGEVTIALRFASPWGEALGGIYRVSQSGGAQFAFSQMEPLDARTAFPCFDEPRFKTPFDITIEAREDDVAIANSSAVAQEPGADGFFRNVFETTEPIPTYLFAVAVGPLDVVEAVIPPNEVRAEPLAFRGVAPRGEGPKLAYAMQHTPAILSALEAWFGIAYPYDKLDIVAVPDFGAGAMENVGLVTFRSNLLLVNETDTPTSRLRFFAYLMAHELAHMWFGNLVTMEWWDDLWLNEAFASWMEHRAVEAWRPAYEPDVELLDWVTGVMDQDGLEAARAIRQPIVSSHDIHNAFDGITYAKGAGVLGMFEQWLGRETFQRGIRAYLTQHRFQNATAGDLMAALGEAGGRDVATPFQTFLTQPGIPFVSARLECEGEGGPRVVMRQTRYLPVGSSAEADRRWQIPVCIRFGSRGADGDDQIACEQMLSEEEQAFPLPTETCPDWIHPNRSGSGYYRWTLPADGLRALQRARGSLTITERLSLADSLRASFNANGVDGGVALEGLLQLASDPHHSVATSSLDFYRGVLDDVVDDAHRAKLRRKITAAHQRDYRRLGWAPRRGATEEENVRLRRAQIVRLFARDLEDRGARRTAARLGAAYVGDEGVNADAVSPDLVETVLTVAIEDGDEAFWRKTRALLTTVADGTIRRSVLTALSATREAALLDDALAISLSDDLRANERLRPIGTLLARPDTRAQAWAWLQANFDALVEKLPPSYAGYLPLLTRDGCEAPFAAEVQAFFAARVEALPGGPRNLAAAVEGIGLCAARVEAQRPRVHAWLDR